MSRKVSAFKVTAENTNAKVLSVPAPPPARPVFGYSWEILCREIEAHITLRDQARQAEEDERAVRRNRNRMLTLFGALLIGIVVTYALQNNVLHLSPHTAKMWAPYSFVITVLLDTSLAIYSWVKRY